MSMADLTGIMGQAWKVYSLSDSRYLTQDDFIVCMETITAVFWGPLSFVCAYCIVAGHPLRHALQSIISLGQLYGDVLYYATCTFEDYVKNTVYSRPEPEIFWGLYVLMNSFWIVFPSILLFQSARETTRVFAIVQKLEAKSGKNE
jgi:cholestenol Delta-isomerase